MSEKCCILMAVKYNKIKRPDNSEMALLLKVIMKPCTVMLTGNVS